jgi:leucyl-tRNA synthetase
LHALDEFPDAPVVSTIGSESEGQLRQFRRLSVADTLARFLSQAAGKPPALLDLTAVDGADGAVRKALVTVATQALGRISGDRIAAHGDQLVVSGDDLLAAVLDARPDGWPEAVLAAQRIAIGGSPGALVRFQRTDGGGDIEVFTTRPDTIFGASFLAVSPSHPVAQLADEARWEAFRAECARVGDDPQAKAGVPLGVSVANPFLPDRALPVWLGNFVVDSYGTGAAGGCPACDQRDLDFARRYGLSVYSIVCPPGEDPDTYQVGSSSYPGGEGTIINSGFLSGLPVAEAIPAAVAHLAGLGRAVPTVQYRRRPLVIADAAPDDQGDLSHLGRSWRFTPSFLTAAGLVARAGRPHALHVTVAENATRHLLDARVLSRALRPGTEPWNEVVLVGDVTEQSGPSVPAVHGEARDAARLAILSDTPPERDVEWSDKRYAAAVKFLDVAGRLFAPGGQRADGSRPGVDRATLENSVVRAVANLEGSLQRRRTNTAVAAVREIVAAAGGTAPDAPAQAFLASVVYAILPDLAERGLASAGQSGAAAPPWPRTSRPGDGADLVELVVQVNGKKRGVVRVARDAGEDAVVEAVRADASLRVHLGDAPVRKTVVVPNRLVNLLV